MTRRFLNQLGERESIREVFLVSDKQLRTNRNGNLYLQLKLSDRTGTINAMMWNTSDHIYRGFDNGDYVRVDGTTQHYNGAIQIIVTDVGKVNAEEVSDEDFLLVSSQDVARMTERLGQILRSINSEHLQGLAECFLTDETFMDKFARAPAAIKHHHAYRGGLLEHVINLLELVLLVAPRYPQLNVDLLLLGAFLHDMGKIDELVYDRELAYSDEGQLVGHIVMAISMLEEKVRQTEKLSGNPFPQGLVLHLKHMILSHHGEYQYGSPKLPMTLEAITLHQLDNLDAKLFSFHQLMSEDANVDSDWTPYHAHLQRKLYKGSTHTKSV